MKAKVLKYKFDGNTVVAPYMELEAYAENIYLSLSDKNEYGNENYDYFHVVCKVENIYFSCGQYSREMLGRRNKKKDLSSIAKTGSRICFRMRKTGTMSPFCRSVFLKNSDLTQFLCCKPVKRTGRNRNKDGRSKRTGRGETQAGGSEVATGT